MRVKFFIHQNDFHNLKLHVKSSAIYSVKNYNVHNLFKKISRRDTAHKEDKINTNLLHNTEI